MAGSRNPNSVFGTGCPPFCLFTLAPCVSAVFPGEPPAWQAPGSLFTGIPQPAGSCVVSPLLKPHSGQAWAATVVGPVNSGSCPRRWSTPPPPPRDPPHWLGKGWGRHGLCGEELEVWDISRSWRGLELVRSGPCRTPAEMERSSGEASGLPRGDWAGWWLVT